jgi:hypothetical protein
MGYRPVDTEYKLQFQDPKFEGLEVVAGSLSVDQFLEMVEAAATATTDMTSAGKLFQMFAGSLVSWNVENSHGPVPATYEGIRSQKLDFILEIVMAWQEAHAAVDPTSQAALNSAAISQAELTLSQASQSLSLPS